MIKQSSSLQAEIDQVLQEVRELVASGAIPPDLVFSATNCRQSDGAAGYCIIGRQAGLPAWFLTPMPSFGSQIRTKILKEHSHWRSALSARSHKPLLEWLGSRNLLSQGIQLDHWGMSTPSRWSESHPLMVLLIKCQGPNGRLGVERLIASHEQGLAEDLARLSHRQATAKKMVSEWEAAGAIGAVDSLASAVISACGLNVRQVLQELETSAAAPFSSNGFDGAFTWVDFRVVVSVTSTDGWRLVSNVLTIPAARLATSFVVSLEGRPLSRLANINPIPPETVMEGVTVEGSGDLHVTLASATLMVF